jgi:hypothetical protein
MAENYFDKFDEVASEPNYFDSFDAPVEEKPTKLAQPTTERNTQPTLTQEILGSRPYSMFRGAIVEPALGLTQLVTSSGMLGDTAEKAVDTVVRAEEEAAREARKAVGREGFDAFGLAGAVISPVNKLARVGQAATKLGNIGRQALAGAGMGAINPVTGEDFVQEKAVQIGLGALFGGGLQSLGEGYTITKDFLKGIPVGAKNKERLFTEYVKDLTPNNREKLAEELRDFGNRLDSGDATVAEALADVPTAFKLNKAQEALEKNQATAGKFINRKVEVQENRVNDLEDVFGSPADLELAKTARMTETTPMRERALEEANVYGEAFNNLTESMAKVKNKPFKERSDTLSVLKSQVQSVKDSGYYPLSSSPLINKIDTLTNTPGTQSNEMLTYTLSKLRGKLGKYANEKGIINSADMYNIRKEINKDVSEYLGSNNIATTSFRAEAAKVESSLKSLIDEEINKAGNSTLWSDYLSNFAKHSKKIDQIEIGQYLKKQLQGTFDEETAGKFVKAMEDAPKTIKKGSGGRSRYESLDEILTPTQLAAVNKTRASLERQQKALLARRGIDRTEGAVLQAGQKVPGFISATVTAAKSFFRSLVSGTQKEFDQKLSDLLLNPQEFAGVLESISKSEADAVSKAIAAKASETTRQKFLNYLKPTAQEVQRATTQDVMLENNN